MLWLDFVQRHPQELQLVWIIRQSKGRRMRVTRDGLGLRLTSSKNWELVDYTQRLLEKEYEQALRDAAADLLQNGAATLKQVSQYCHGVVGCLPVSLRQPNLKQVLHSDPHHRFQIVDGYHGECTVHSIRRAFKDNKIVHSL